jgi:hypothetical protein
MLMPKIATNEAAVEALKRLFSENKPMPVRREVTFVGLESKCIAVDNITYVFCKDRLKMSAFDEARISSMERIFLNIE